MTTTAALAYPCRDCGAATTFAPGTSALRCDHCGATSAIAASPAAIVEHPLGAALVKAAVSEPAAREVACKRCGARTTVTVQATRCPFCDDAMVVEAEATPTAIAPESVVPFAIDRATANERFVRWLHARRFAPSDLVRRAVRDGLDGVYLPYWTYDSTTVTTYAGERGEHYHVTESYTDSAGKRQTREVQKTRWSPASGSVTVEFDDVLVCATSSVPADLIDRLEPWELSELVPYDGKYLAGFVAERYRIDLEAGLALAEERMRPAVARAIERDIGGDDQRIESMTIRHTRPSFKHVLLPVWISSFRYRDRVYRVLVHGQTGEIVGERPWSASKLVSLWSAIVLGVLVAWYVATHWR